MLKTVELTTKDLGYYINLVDRAVAGFERIDLNFENSTVGKMLSNSASAYYREIIHERKSRLMWQKPQPPQPSATINLISVSSHHHQGKTLQQQKDYDSLKAQMMVSIF